MRKPNEAYLEKARKLKQEEVERVLARTRRKLMRRIEDQEMDMLDVVAIQMEIEDAELQEWRERWAEIQKKTKTR